jgi:TPR repeat protein
MTTSDEAASHYRQAVQHYGNKEYTLAFNHFLAAAQLGDLRSQFRVGEMYRHGEVYRLMEQFEQFRRSGEMGASNLKEDLSAAVMWFRRAAEVGYTPAQKVLGLCYCHGRGVAKDATIGRRWLVRAARHRDRDALFFLANYYHLKWGGKGNEPKAFRWYSISAKRGHPESKKVLETWGS